MKLNRRNFLKLTALTAGAVATNALALTAAKPDLTGHVVYHFRSDDIYRSAQAMDQRRTSLRRKGQALAEQWDYTGPKQIVAELAANDTVTVLVKKRPGVKPPHLSHLPSVYMYHAAAIYDGDSGTFLKSTDEGHNQQLLRNVGQLV